MHYWSFNHKDWHFNCRLYDVKGKYAYVAMLALYMDRETPLPLDVVEIVRQIELPGEVELVEQILKDHYKQTKKGYTMTYADELLGKIEKKRERAQSAANQRSKAARDNRLQRTDIGSEIGDNIETDIGSEIGSYPITQLPNNPKTQKPKNPISQEPKNPISQEPNKPLTKNQENISTPVGAASAMPPLHGSLTLEEAQEVIEKAHAKHPGLQRFKDDRTGEPMDDMLFGAILLWIKNQSRAIELGITTDPAEAIRATIQKAPEPTEPSRVKAQRPDDCDEQVWKDWMRVRGRNALTDTAWGAMLKEARKAGVTPAEAVKVCAERGWRGFRADWLDKDKAKRKGFEAEDLTKQDYSSHDGEKFIAGSAAEYFYGKDYVRQARERYEKPYDRSREELA